MVYYLLLYPSTSLMSLIRPKVLGKVYVCMLYEFRRGATPPGTSPWTIIYLIIGYILLVIYTAPKGSGYLKPYRIRRETYRYTHTYSSPSFYLTLPSSLSISFSLFPLYPILRGSPYYGRQYFYFSLSPIGNTLS